MMNIRVYLFEDYDPKSLKVIELLKTCNLEFTFNSYKEKNMDYISQEILLRRRNKGDRRIKD